MVVQRAYGLAVLIVTCLGMTPSAVSQVTVTVAFATTNSTVLHRGFSGFNTGLDTATEYYDVNLQNIASALSPGWLRYPAGTGSDAFDWTNGISLQAWIDSLAAHSDTNVATELQNSAPILAGKGGAQFADFARMAANLNARIVVCVNAFTDGPESAGAMAQYALSNNINVAVWELANEPYLFVGPSNFFTSATDYANKMKPYRDAIKAADSNALVAIFFDRDHAAWGDELGQYTNQYWDAVTYHHYPGVGSTTNFSDYMAHDNDTLVNGTTTYVTSYLMTNTPPGMSFLISEYDPTLPSNGLPDGTLYGGIFTAEYALRMSTIPQMKFVGMHEWEKANGINMTNLFKNVVTTAYNNGAATNTAGLPFGFYLTAQALGVAVANGALARSGRVYPTTATGGSTVPTSNSGNIPAIYAQAYEGINGKRYVVLTNKGASNEVVALTQDGLNVTNQLLMTYVTATDPSLVNSNPPPNNLQIQTRTTASPVPIPPYSVVRLEWQVFPIPVPSLTVSYAKATLHLSWTGLTNVDYLLQTSTNFLTWSTLITYSGTNGLKQYSTIPTEPFRFYRITVP